MDQTDSLDILVVEDEPKTAAMLASLLKQKFSARIQTALDCESARKSLLEHRFNLITLDYQLPDGNGLELLKEIQSTDNPPMVIMVTGHGDEKVASRAFTLGASGYVVKDNRIAVMLPEAVDHVLSQLALKRAEKEARLEREKAREYLDIAAVIMIAIDINGEITMINKKGCELFGFPESEIVGKQKFDFRIPEDYKNEVRNTLSLAALDQNNVIDQFQIPVRAGDGTERIVNWHTTRLKDEEGRVTGFLSSGEDITDRRRTDRITRAQRDIAIRLAKTDDFNETVKAAFITILEATGLDCGGVYVMDEETGSLDLVYHEGLSDDFVKAVSHYEPDSPNAVLVRQRKSLYADYSDLETDKTGAEEMESLKAIAVVPITFKETVIGCVNVSSHEFTTIHEDSRRIIEALSGQIGQAITRSRLSVALKESEATYRTLFNNAPEVIGLMDMDGLIKDVNDAMCHWLGYSKEEIIGKSIPELPFLSQEGVNEMTEKLIRYSLGDKIPPFVLEHIARSGETRYGNVTGTYIRDETGGIVGGMIMTTDITDQISVEQELREYERQYKSFFENTKELIIVVDGNSMVINVNPAAVEALGYSDKDGLVGNPATDVYFNPEDRESILKPLLENGYFKNFEVTLKKKDGSPLYLIGSAVAYFDESGNPTQTEAVLTDITRLKEAGRALLESEELFRNVFDEAGIGMALINTKDHTIIKANNVLSQITGYSREELSNYKYLEMIHPEDIEAVRDLVEKLIAGKIPTMRTRTRITKKNGDIAWWDASVAAVRDELGEILYAIGSAFDITEQITVEEELMLTKERWERSFEELADGVFLLTIDYEILECNKALGELLEQDRKDIVGMKCYELIHGIDTPPDFCVCLKVKEDKNIVRAELFEPYLGKNLEVAANPIMNPDGEIEQIVHVIHDVTGRRKTESELQKHQEHLEELVRERTSELENVNKRLTEEIAWRMKAESELKRANNELEDYAHTVSHDMKGPLSSISISAEMLLDEADNIESEKTRSEIQELVGTIQKHTGKSFRLVDDILSLSRAGNIPEELEDVDVREMVIEILGEKRSAIDGFKVVLTIDDDLGKIRANPTQVYVLFSNIIGNAIIHNDSKSPQVAVSYLGKGRGGAHGYLVKDNGSGIPPGEEESIFRAFRKGPVSKGTGVGLATVKKIVDVYGGEIKAYSENGACFEFSLKDFH